MGDAGQPGFQLIERNGQTGCPIVLPSDATECERYAAQELASHLAQMASREFPVIHAAPADGAAVHLLFDEKLGGEEYRFELDQARRTLRILGGRPRGVLYGVYGLLGEELGCRWFTPEVSRIPRLEERYIDFGSNRPVRPRFEYREVFWTEAFDGTWAARNRLNSSNARLEAKHGGRIRYGAFVHTFDRILPVEKHFEAHPEYYSLVNGKRLRAHTQLCLTHPDVLEHAIRAVREWIRTNPEATIFSVSQNDWRNPCECPPCKTIDDAEGSHAGTMLTFVNAVADAIGKDFPNVAIDTLAYQYTRKPPRTVKPRRNVIVRLCSIECCFAHPLAQCPEETNRSFVEDLRGWQKLTDRLYIWDYTTDFAHYLLPFPNVDVLGSNVRTFADSGVAGLFEQGNYSRGGGGELAELRSWVLARLLWNPQLQEADLVREFVAGVYGPAAPDVLQYLELRRKAIDAAGNHVRIFDGPNRPDLAPNYLRAWDTALEEAERKTGDDGALRARVVRLRMPIWYAQVVQARETPAIMQRSATRLAEAAKAGKLTNFREHGNGIEGDLRKLELLQKRRPREATPGVMAIEDHRFQLYREGELASMVADETADDGMAIRLVGRTHEWAVQWKPDALTELPAGPHTVRARVRVEKRGSEGPAFHGGLYDSEARKSVGSVQVAAKVVPDDGYRMYDLGTCELRRGIYAYIAPDDNEANITALFIDRLELVPATK